MFSFCLRQILTLPFECLNRNRDSSDQATFFQCFLTILVSVYFNSMSKSCMTLFICSTQESHTSLNHFLYALVFNMVCCLLLMVSKKQKCYCACVPSWTALNFRYTFTNNRMPSLQSSQELHTYIPYWTILPRQQGEQEKEHAQTSLSLVCRRERERAYVREVQVTCNCFSISDGELQDVGVGLYPSMSLLNHDCRPNCVMMFEGKTIKLRAVRVIRACEELTISYTDVLAPCRERQSHLQEQYNFLCQCKRCTTEDRDCEMLAGEKSAWMAVRDSIPHLQQLQSEQHWEALLKESQTLLHRYADVVPDKNIYVLRLLDLATDACISLDDYERALEYGSRALEPYKFYYCDPHPSRAVELLRVGKLQHFLGSVEEAQRSFTRAYDIMKVTHGAEHALTNEVSKKLGECQAELGRV
ncbi:histone-lysine N-methyltransferase SMYD3 [Triplophysa rosa]|uniref:[histone H3]-lysine(4) N-trimethyltransferase n=1 Tax=Triplophysa rosa TaxID=992332 RepID=A0A9W7WMP4_TRIRA|nr:histone-lysine N-methyltransferase SMYD3 [Triplophysa rosa]